MKKPFLTTAFGSYVKVFAATIVAQFITAISAQLEKNGDITSWDVITWKSLLVATIAGVIPMSINWFNKNYPLYGTQPKETIVVDNPQTPGVAGTINNEPPKV